MDPPEAGPVLRALAADGGRLEWVLVTHGHRNHCAGVFAALRRARDAW